MTDFFADLEREIRAAHPRRSRPVVPVAPVLMGLVAVVAIVAVASSIPLGGREVAQAPQPSPALTPLASDGCTSEIDVLKRRLPVFSRPASQERPPRDVASQGQIHVFLEETRVVETPGGARYFVYPGCGTTVCLLREGDGDSACGGAVTAGHPDPDHDMVVVTHESERGAELQVVGLVTRGVRAVRARNERGEVGAVVDVADGVFHTTYSRGWNGPGPPWFEVLTGS